MTRLLGQAFAAIAGLAAGAVLVFAGVYYWPFAFEDRDEHALSGMEHPDQLESFFLNITADNILGTHGGGFPFKPFPEGMPLLDGGNLRNTFALVTKFRDAPDGEVIAFGTELEIAHEDSRFLSGLVMTHTLWSIVVPGRGTLHLYQTENNWRLLKRVLLPVLLTRKAFNGEFRSVNTIGPLPGYRGVVIGGTGEFAGATGTFVEIGTLRRMEPDGALEGSMELRIAHERS